MIINDGIEICVCQIVKLDLFPVARKIKNEESLMKTVVKTFDCVRNKVEIFSFIGHIQYSRFVGHHQKRK